MDTESLQDENFTNGENEDSSDEHEKEAIATVITRLQKGVIRWKILVELDNETNREDPVSNSNDDNYKAGGVDTEDDNNTNQQEEGNSLEL